ncbi:hypothetical protein EV182_001312 [Spiromyces aspiralis]|uniref:Uncharacterized protein n=1 Tax=Spiromyces aspiralis TaxID=68401 RepID=A0ACC1HJK6_9FUNG|nr:hypothetical protein EV182_001312 [Spiromyces aspiralis]
MNKTVKVRVPKRVMHPVVKKASLNLAGYWHTPNFQVVLYLVRGGPGELQEILQHKNYLAHDENDVCKLGDIVRIEHCGKISKLKSFAVAEIIRKAQTHIDPDTGKEYR